ncbi:carboxypeptidase-like regulatory domain-containing protein [Thalassomonas sp. RHCl1]|uniref:carboxypeptidase-like regulatory domain-containing protein n=1 Tax=Thalassomonas sp. RHCl1 TaxID=2995320 RepID=UPI00248CB1E1|nr:carboxypeptidase-like regulatory domain-containing protein [Thalassomonas sp. RHCl1]
MLKLLKHKKHTSLINALIHSRKCQLAIAIIACFLYVIFIQPQEVRGMFNMFKRYQVEMSPEVRGRITDGGEPVAGIQVARTLLYEGYQNGKEQLEHTTTDTNGRFSFKPMVVKSRKPGGIFGQNLPVLQAVYVERDEQLFSLWSTSKSWKSIQPLADLMLQLNCDLQDKEVQHLINATNYGGLPRQSVTSICHWQGELISTYYNNELISSYDEI